MAEGDTKGYNPEFARGYVGSRRRLLRGLNPDTHLHIRGSYESTENMKRVFDLARSGREASTEDRGRMAGAGVSLIGDAISRASRIVPGAMGREDRETSFRNAEDALLYLHRAGSLHTSRRIAFYIRDLLRTYDEGGLADEKRLIEQLRDEYKSEFAKRQQEIAERPSE